MIHKFLWKKFPPDVRRQLTACGMEVLHAPDIKVNFIWTLVDCPECRKAYVGPAPYRRTIGKIKQEGPQCPKK